jgi:hypothetical protein
MKKLLIRKNLTELDYLKLCKEWDENEDACVDSSDIIALEDIIHCANIVFSQPQ